MKAQRSGHIINVASVAGHLVSSGGVVYSASKFAVRAISEGLRKEVKPDNIRSTILSPGAVDTELPASTRAEGMAQAMQVFYERNAIPASSFARCVLFAIAQPDEVDINEILFGRRGRSSERAARLQAPRPGALGRQGPGRVRCRRSGQPDSRANGHAG
jgi:NADP-dependent 3-hydroxy acid dehydrogenase YdfG